LTVELLTEWVLGKRPNDGVIIACYNETLSGRFSKQVRGGIQEKSIPGGSLVFSDWFPGVKIKEGDGAMQLWALEGSHFSFLATSPGGTMTGIGCQLLIIDDLIKNAEEANNPRVLDEHWEWYNNTVLSRIEKNGKQIVIQTRWHTNDLSGKLINHEPDKWHVIKMPAQNDDGSMLCADILSKEEFEDRKTKTDPIIIAGNYQQEPYDAIDKLYHGFKTYTIDQIPDKWERIEGYADTADGGGDYFSGPIYGICKGYAYILDFLFTAEDMDQTEIKFSRMIEACGANLVWIESNNGGRGFSKNIEKKLRENGNLKTSIRWFHQSENKEARILTNAFSVMNSVLFPADWRDKWPMLAKELDGMGRSEKWKHDDAADALTGIIEKSLSKQIVFS
jgi:predicted phage terminase large subunit-like protein